MKICSVEGCGRKYHALGLCRQHWVRQRTFGRLHKIRGIEKPVCSVEGCVNVSDIKGLCPTHYQRNHRYGRVEKVRSGKQRKHPLYSMWFERKSVGALASEWLDFWKFVEDIGERPGKNFVLIRIRDEPYGPTNFEWKAQLKRRSGETLKQWHARKWKSRREHFPLYESDRSLKRKYGITLADYDEMLKAQDGVCAICEKNETSYDTRTGGIRRLSVDHCHKTGKVRSLLCFRCNSVIGKIEESQGMVKAIAAYLQKHQKEF